MLWKSCIAIPLGTISALKENTWLDHFVRVVAIAGIATPSFWLGIMSLVLVLDITYFTTGKAWLPPITYVSFWQDPLSNLAMVLLPAITVGYRYSAVTMRLTRSAPATWKMPVSSSETASMNTVLSRSESCSMPAFMT